MQNKDIKFVFFGTPEVAAETLEILKSHSYLPSVVITAPDKPVGRKQVMTPPPVKVWALQNNIPVLQPEKLDQEFSLKLSAVSCQLFVVVAYGKIFPEWLINMPKLGTLNIHYSLLPKYRGAAPVQAAILNGEKETGVSIQKMVKELDAGDIIAQEKVEIEANEKTPELLTRLIKIGGELLVKVLNTPSPSGHSPFAGGEKQDESKVTFAPKIKKEDGLIDLADNAVKNYNKFRAYYNWPRTYFVKDNKRVIITDACLENNVFVIKKVIPEGGKETFYSDDRRS